MSSPKAARPSIPAVGITILLAIFAVLSFAGPADAARTVLSAGHVDGINPVLEGGELRVTVRDDTSPPNDVVRAVDDVIFHGTPAHHRSIPTSGYYDFGFLDHPSGTFWHLPSNNQVDKLFLGWGTESPTLREGGVSRFDGPLQLSLVGYEGPGYFYLYQLGDEEIQMLASGAPMAGVTNRWNEPIPTHVHANWAFSEPGLHKLQFRVSGKLAGGETVSDTQEYRFFIGEPTGIDVAGLPDLEVAGLEQRHEIGSQVTLTASQSPATTQDHYHWFQRCGEEGWQYIDPSLSEALELTVTEQLVGCEIQARLYDGQHVLIATSAPETLKSTQPTLTITGLEGHYHPGDQLELGLEFDPPEDHPHVHWFQRSGSGEWAEVGGGVTYGKTLTLEDDGTQIKAVQGHGEEGYESEPVTLHVEDHGHVHRTLTITGLKDHYHSGDQLELGLRFDPPEDHPHVHWFQRAGTGEWAEIGGGVELRKTLASADDGSQIKAVQGHGDEGYESAPVTVRVEDHGDGPGDRPGRLKATLKPAGPKRLGQLRRRKALKVRFGLNAAGRATIKASIAPRAARRIGIRAGRKSQRVVIGSARVRRSAAGAGPVKVRVKAPVLRRLKRARGSLTVRLVARARSDDGRTTARRAALRLRR